MTPRALLQPTALGLAILASFLFPGCHLAPAFPLPALDGSGDLRSEHSAHLSGRITVPIRNVQVGAVLHQDVDELNVAALEREEDGHFTVPVLGVHVGAFVKQHPCHPGVPDRRGACVVQRCVARDVRGVGRGARINEKTDNIDVARRGVWRGKLEALRAENGECDEPEPEGRLCAAQVRCSARIDGL